MLFKKSMVIGIALAGVLALSSSAIAAGHAPVTTGKATLTAVKGVDINEVAAHAQKGTVTIIKGISPLVPDGQTGKSTSTAAAKATLSPVDNVTLDNNIVVKGTPIVDESVVPQIPGGQTGKTTAAK